MKIAFSFFLSIYSQGCAPASWAARHTTVCLDNETEGLLIAVQDQALSTRAMQYVYSAATSPLCRLCGSCDETVEHLVSGCSFFGSFSIYYKT